MDRDADERARQSGEARADDKRLASLRQQLYVFGTLMSSGSRSWVVSRSASSSARPRYVPNPPSNPYVESRIIRKTRMLPPTPTPWSLGCQPPLKRVEMRPSPIPVHQVS